MITLHADHYFCQGLMHTRGGSPCQDYAVSGKEGDAAYAVVSDGCSGGGKTDVGARIVALSTKRAICSDFVQEEPTSEWIDIFRIKCMEECKDPLALIDHDLLATCLCAYISPKGGFYQVHGDGVVAAVYLDGSIAARSIEWANNTPCYPVYREDNFSAFKQAHLGNALPRTQEGWKHDVAWSPVWQCIDGSGDCIEVGIEGTFETLSPDYLRELDYLALFTDGVKQVDGMNWQEVVQGLLSFKSPAGEFAKRRMIRFVQDSLKVGKGPIDDLSYAVIRVEHSEDEQ